jgi:hypothetical protein
LLTLPNEKLFGPVCAGVLALALGQVACADATSPQDGSEDREAAEVPAVGVLEVAPGRVVLEQIGSTGLLSATLLDAAGSGQEVLPTWFSRNSSVVAVNHEGVIQAMSAGTVTLVGSYRSLRDSAIVSVGPAETASLTILVPDDSIPAAGYVLLTAEVIDTAGVRTTNPVVSFSTPTPGVLSISANGAMAVVTGVAPGTGYVIAQRGGFADTATIRVGAASSLSTSAAESALLRMNPVDLLFDRPNSMWFVSAIHADASGSRTVVPDFRSTNTGVVRIDGQGWVRATGNGKALIVGHYNGLADTVPVQVGGVQVASLALKVDVAAIATIGSHVRLFADVLDTNGRAVINPALTWTSLNPLVASVSGDGGVGTVTGLAGGLARIVVQRGTRSDTATVQVGGGSGSGGVPASIDITPAQDTIGAVGGTIQLTATVRDAQGQPIAQSAATWSSLDPAIATVGTAGPSAGRTITGVKAGLARITASTNGLADTALVHVGASQQSVSWTLSHSPASPTISSSVAISVTASSPVGVKSVAILVDGTVVKTCSGGTCSHSQSYAAGGHTYGASATDNNGTVSHAPPSSFSVTSGSTQPGVVPANLMPTIGPLLPRGSAQTLQALDLLFLAEELDNYLKFASTVPNTTGSTANHYGALRSRIQWAIRTGQPFGAAATSPSQHMYGRGRHVVLHYLQKYSKPNAYSLDPHNNTGLADVEVLWWLERTPEAWDHIWTTAHRSMSVPYDRFSLKVGDPRQVAVPLQSYNAAHRLAIPFKPSPFTSSTWNDHNATSWRNAGEKQIAAVLAGGSIRTNGAVHSPAHSGSKQCGTATVCEAYFMSAMVATEFLRWHAFVAPNQPAHSTAIRIVDHLISELARHGTACLPYLSSYVGKCDADLAAFFVWPALVAWQETGDDKYRTFALQNLKAAQRAWVAGTKQFNQTFSTGAQTADALLAGQRWH